MPLFIEDDYVRASMRQDKNNQKILNQGMFADMVLTSINDLESVNKKNFWLGYMTPQMYQEICDKGAGQIFAGVSSIQ